MRSTIDIFGIPVDNIDMKEAVDKVLHFLDIDKTHMVFTPNAEIMMDAKNDSCLKSILQAADLLVADGAGVVLSSKILGTPVKSRVPGIDLTKHLFEAAGVKPLSFFFYGAKPGVAKKAAEIITNQFPGVSVNGISDGYVKQEQMDNLIERINSSDSDILLVALGAPKQEKWIYENRDKLNVKVCIGIGGSFDVFAGEVNLAPDFFRKHGLEWLYRLYKEPWRFRRMLKLPKFIFISILARLGIIKNA